MFDQKNKLDLNDVESVAGGTNEEDVERWRKNDPSLDLVLGMENDQSQTQQTSQPPMKRRRRIPNNNS